MMISARQQNTHVKSSASRGFLIETVYEPLKIILFPLEEFLGAKRMTSHQLTSAFIILALRRLGPVGRGLFLLGECRWGVYDIIVEILISFCMI